MRTMHCVIGLVLVPAAVFAQAAKTAKTPPPKLNEAQQIASSVLPLPAEFRQSARILGYREGSTKLVPLKEGTGPFTCLATGLVELIEVSAGVNARRRNDTTPRCEEREMLQLRGRRSEGREKQMNLGSSAQKLPPAG